MTMQEGKFLLQDDTIFIFLPMSKQVQAPLAYDARTMIQLHGTKEVPQQFSPCHAVHSTTHGTIYTNKQTSIFIVKNPCLYFAATRKLVEKFNLIVQACIAKDQNEMYFLCRKTQQLVNEQLQVVEKWDMLVKPDCAACMDTKNRYLYMHGGRMENDSKLSDELVRMDVQTRQIQVLHAQQPQQAPIPAYCMHSIMFVAPSYLVMLPGFTNRLEYQWYMDAVPFFALKYVYLLNLTTMQWQRIPVPGELCVMKFEPYYMDCIGNRLFICADKCTMIDLPIEHEPYQIKPNRAFSDIQIHIFC